MKEHIQDIAIIAYRVEGASSMRQSGHAGLPLRQRGGEAAAAVGGVDDGVARE